MKEHLLMGDIHANFDGVKRVIETRGEELASITIVGDVGLGFPHTHEIPFVSPVPIHFIRGNHDNPEFIRNLPKEWAEANWHYIPDGTIRNGILYVGGAWSIDWQMRVPGVSWWDNEELTYQEQENIINHINLSSAVIHTVISHDAPDSVYDILHPLSKIPNRTSSFLEHLRTEVLTGPHKPTLWVFGHHHKNRDAVIDGTRFICLNIERTMPLDMTYANTLDTSEVE